MFQIVNKFVIILFVSNSVWAASYYVDPVKGSTKNPGTIDQPWRTLQEVFSLKKTFEAGDIVYLRSGYHGDVVIKGENDSHVTIKAYKNEKPSVSRIQIRNARFWHIKGLKISPEFAQPYTRYTLVDISENVSDIKIENCMLFSAKDSSGWSADDWVKKSCFGVVTQGTNIRLANNHLLNVDHGFLVIGKHSIVENNIIENFSGDGICALGDHGVYQYNVIKNCFNVDGNHDDGIQSWSVGDKGVGSGVVKDVLLNGNLIINHSDPNQKYKGTPQGIGCFDGFYEDWVITNNIVIVDHWHGITLGGAKNCRIINNTVVDINEGTPGPPWIVIDKHKDGRESSNNIIRNNLAEKFTSKAGIGRMDHNMVITSYEDFFEDYRKFNLRLKKGSPACDAGSNEAITKSDFLRNNRVHNGKVDIGAIEYIPDNK
ncbi:MAG: choice-of-anchor Q domain-containing protein [Planctomycetota bacterium]|jgi:parallel beta-helix repeat protein